MEKERAYTKATEAEHIKAFGQYFTNETVADFMCGWACRHAQTMLDPAAGNSVFLRYAKKHNPRCRLTGFEIDPGILACFGNPAKAELICGDYLRGHWEETYDAIVCNPPYNRFQAVGNRSEILQDLYAHTGVRCSGYTNLYLLFLLKSIYQLSEKGRLAYIIPTEFMNSRYGTPIKQLLLERRLLRAVINFKNDAEMFFNATTTCCILLVDREDKEQVCFYNLPSFRDLTPDLPDDPGRPAVRVPYGQLTASEKWRCYLRQEQAPAYRNLVPVSQFCAVSRGIATGANDFFCFSRSRAQARNIPEHCLRKCVCRSADVKTPFFTDAVYRSLADADKTVYLLDVSEQDSREIRAYLEEGRRNGVDKRYLPASRTPWYSMEQKPPAPIWVSSACRKGIKFVRNLAGASSLTTFHSVFVHPAFAGEVDVIFSYFLTPVAQEILRQNRKELGNGLEKFQPNDLNGAGMLDIRRITPEDRARILRLYHEMLQSGTPSRIAALNEIFLSYLEGPVL